MVSDGDMPLASPPRPQQRPQKREAGRYALRVDKQADTIRGVAFSGTAVLKGLCHLICLCLCDIGKANDFDFGIYVSHTQKLMSKYHNFRVSGPVPPWEPKGTRIRVCKLWASRLLFWPPRSLSCLVPLVEAGGQEWRYEDRATLDFLPRSSPYPREHRSRGVKRSSL